MSSHRYPWKWWLKDLRSPAEDAPTVFSTFACGGGSSMGYKRAGYNVLGNCEIDPKIAKIYDANLHPRYSYVMDLREFNTLESFPDELYHLDVLDGSPPCSTFSSVGLRDKAWGVEKAFAEGQKRQRLDDLFFVFLETVSKLRPKAFVAENVTGLLTGKAAGYVNEILKTARDIGYDVQLFKLNAAFMGVPQIRERVFFIGNRMGYPKLSLEFDESPILFGDIRSQEGGKILGPMTLERLGKKRHHERHIGNIAERTIGRRANFGTAIMWDDEVCRTITTKEAVRACDDTCLSNADMISAGSFPQDYDFCGNNHRFIIGMSVPPSMMANVAHEIRTQWLEA